MDDLVELCNPAYKVPLDKKLLNEVIAFVSKTVTLENFVLALGRFLLRCLS